MKSINVLFCILSAILITSCGGGGGSNAPTPTPQISQLPMNASSKYVGFWIGQCFQDTTTSERKFVDISSTGSTTLRFTTTMYEFTDVNCMSGTLTQVITGSIELTGVKTIEGNISVETGNLSFDGSAIAPVKNIYRVTSNPNQLFDGDFQSIDSDGYPKSLDGVDYLFRA